MGKKKVSSTSSSAISSDVPSSSGASVSKLSSIPSTCSNVRSSKSQPSPEPQPHSEIMAEVDMILKQLETEDLSNSCFFDKHEHVIQRLQHLYKQISIKNKVDSKREDILSQEIGELQRKNKDSAEEVKILKGRYYGAEAKMNKLEVLSRNLTDRIRSIETKTSDDIKYEKEDRLRMSYEFSAKINAISLKLDDLRDRRVKVMTENERLKQVLRTCIDEFTDDKDPEFDEIENHQDLNNPGESLNPDSEGTNLPQSTADSKETKAMELEDDMSTIMQLSEQEDLLKLKTLQFMTVFESFQQRLLESNKIFREKQSNVDQLTREIRTVEKSNVELAQRISDCSSSSAIATQSIEKPKAEKERYIKLIDKQRELIERFQADIKNMESK